MSEKETDPAPAEGTESSDRTEKEEIKNFLKKL